MNSEDKHAQEIVTARVTGIWYLLMAISGGLGYVVFHPQVFDPGAPQKTLTNLMDHENLARIRLLMEFVIIVSQALTAIWFYKLFKNINEWAAWSVGIWGTVNAVAIMVSAISMGAAIEIANHSSQTLEDKITIIELLSGLINHAWGVGGLFFGLWLIPMGFIVTRSKRMPLWLGRILMAGGVGYLLSTGIKYFGIESSWTEYLIIPATVGEFWMIGYLLIFGIRPEKE